ncbi:hypothetical protein ACFX2A_015202 [Malus domestica]
MLSEETRQNEAELWALVSKTTNLHKEYYTVKWVAARDDLIESLKTTRLVSMSKEQVRKVEQLRQKMRYKEDKVEREMER